MPLLARKFYQIPEDALHYIGITGTKGKTTTAYYIKAVFDEFMEQTGGSPIAFFTSVETYDGRERKPSRITTPESMELYRHFRNAYDSGIRWAAMEVSSQALKYGRVLGIPYDVGVFLNISEDHISPVEHRDFQDYFQSKLLLFRQVKTACVSLDSPFSRQILAGAASAERIVTFGAAAGADFRVSQIRTEQGRICFRVTCSDFDETFTLAMHGTFNVGKCPGGHRRGPRLRHPRVCHESRAVPGYRHRPYGGIQQPRRKDPGYCGLRPQRTQF